MKTKLILTFLVLITLSGCKKDDVITFDYLKERLVGDWYVEFATGAPYYNSTYMGIINIAENGTYSANFSNGWFNAEGNWSLDIDYGTSYYNKMYNDCTPGCSIEIGGKRLFLRYNKFFSGSATRYFYDDKGNVAVAVSYTDYFGLYNSNSASMYHLYRVEN